MKVNSITPHITNKQFKYNNQPSEFSDKQQPQQLQSLAIPTGATYIAYHPNFEGGYSLNLAETIQNLDKLAAKQSDIYPKNIREWAEMILEEGNKEKDTLISIHKKLYKNIKSCFSLDDLKAKFPDEFENVKSITEVDYREGSLLDDIANGRLEYFNQEEEPALQIIKLYWGEGFSLNDLTEYTGGKNLNYVMNKLNIPKVNKHYGQVLKLSDPEYNERLTREMAQKRWETLDRKAQLNEGESVYIKRGPLSAEHRQHISEGLIKSYQENPERLFAMSERKKQFYIDNPEEREILHRVMIKAWYNPSAENIKKALSKFMKRFGVKNFSIEELTTPEQISGEKSKLMRRFWSENNWARKSFSKNMEYGWKKVKEEQNMFYNIDLTPELFKTRFYAWCEKQGIDTSDIRFDDFKYYPHKPELNQLDTSKLSIHTRNFIDDSPGDESQKMANTYQMTLMKFGKTLKELENAPVSNDTKTIALMLRRVIHSCIFDHDNLQFGRPAPRVMDAQEVQHIYVVTAQTLMDKHENKLIKKLVQTLNESYNYLDKNWHAGEPLRLSPDCHNF